MERIYIVNITTTSFFKYDPQHETDNGYINILLDLFTPPVNDVHSHWNRLDKIVFCPPHLVEHIHKNYNELHL
jgi:hypothetical protein